MLPAMNVANAGAPRDDTTLRPSASAAEAVAEHATPTGCPFLLAEPGGWRLDLPSRDHRCAAFVPSAPLSPEKQTRLCLTTDHTACPTYLASLAARTARTGSLSGDRATRWGLARTTTVIEDAGGMRTRVLGAALDRRRWPAIPAVLLVGTLATLAVSGFGANLSGAPSGTATPAPSQPLPTGPPATVVPSTAAPTIVPTTAPTVVPSEPPTPAPTPRPTRASEFRIYQVKPGDTLSAIAARFDTTVSAIVNANDLGNANQLKVGQRLRIPN